MELNTVHKSTLVTTVTSYCLYWGVMGEHSHEFKACIDESSQLLFNAPSNNGHYDYGGEKGNQNTNKSHGDNEPITATDNSASVQERTHTLQRARRVLYASHTFASVTLIGWRFCLSIFLTALAGDQSLVLVASFGLFYGIVVCLFGSAAGASLDNPKRSRLFIARVFIVVKNLSLALSAMCCFYLLRMVKIEAKDSVYSDDDQFLLKNFLPPLDTISIVLVIALHIFGGLAELTEQSIAVAMERDWVVVMSKFLSTSISSSTSSNVVNECDEEVLPTETSLVSLSIISAENTTTNEEGISSQEKDDCIDNDTISAELSIGTESVDSSTTTSTVSRIQREKIWLTQTNTAMKQIYLLSKIAAPAVAGIFVASFDDSDKDKVGGDGPWHTHQYDLSYSAAILGAFNLLSLFVEYSCTRIIYDLVPPLSIREGTSIHRSACTTTSTSNRGQSPHQEQLISDSGTTNSDSLQLKESSCAYPSERIGWGIFRLPQGLSLFLQQSVSYAGVAIALLSLNVLTFSSLMTGFLIWKGVNYGTIGVLRGISAGIGFLGTMAFQISVKRYDLVKTGMWSISFQFACLGLCFISVYMPLKHATGDFDLGLGLWLLVIGVCLSRIGLWTFDLTITQLYQQQIPEQIRGVIGGVQRSLSGLFELSTYALGLMFSDPEEFHVLVTIGFSSVGMAMMVYHFGIYRRRERFKYY